MKRIWILLLVASPLLAQHSVTLTWTQSTTPGVTGNNVYRGFASGGPYTLLTSPPLAATTTYTDTAVSAGQHWFYVVTAVDPNGESISSNEVSALVPTCLGVIVNPGDNLQTLVTANAAGTTFCLQPGVHHDSVTSLKNGDVFSSPNGTTADGVIENGTTTLTGWSQVTIGGTQYWTAAGGTPLIDAFHITNCEVGFEGCAYPQDLYFDNATYRHYLALASVATGGWYFEYAGLAAASVAAGGSGYQVGDILGVAGGIPGNNGTVIVATLSGSAVATVTIRSPGAGYPTSPTVETTSGGHGTGCTLTINSSPVGVVNNVYLIDNPTGHTVELGTSNYFLQSNTATSITAQGLIVEKYAPWIQHGAINAGSENHSAGNLNWIAQNNELRLNHGAGVDAYNNGGGIQILGNSIHDNGQGGFQGGGAGAVIRGNTSYHNNVDHVAPGFECGNKYDGSNSLISFNTIHDDIDSPGLWVDVYAQNVVLDHNTVYNNGCDGIRYEISDTGTITNNVVYGNGAAPACVGLRNQISYTSSSHGAIKNNDITTNSSGAGIVIQYASVRGGCGAGCTVPAGMNVSNNRVTITNTGDLAAEASSSSGDTTAWQPGVFNANCYQVASLPWANTNWRTGTTNVSPRVNFAAWQAVPEDAAGSLSLACPSPIQNSTIYGAVQMQGTVRIQ